MSARADAQIEPLPASCPHLRHTFVLPRAALDVVDVDPRVADVTQPALRVFVQTPSQQLSNPRRCLRR